MQLRSKEGFMKYLIIIFIILLLIIITLISCKKKKNNTIQTDIQKSLDDFKNRKQYSSFSEETLKIISDEHLEQAIIDYILDYKIKNNYEKEYEIITNLSNGFQYIYLTWILEAEVNNGGFNQYFYNTSAKFTKEVLIALKALNANEFYKITNQAIKLFNKEYEIHKKAKKGGTLEAFLSTYEDSNLDTLDDEFYKYPENLSELRIKYIRTHVEEFLD
jgi:hypothetical protein